jgi:PKD repeat protein
MKWVTGTTVDSTYSWDFGDGSPVVYEKNPSHTFTTPGTYTVSLTGSAKGYFSTGCSDIKTMTVTVTGTIESLFTIDSSKTPDITFTNTSKNSEASTVYSWAFGDGGVSTDINPTHTYAVPGTYTVTLVATGPCGTSTSTHTLTIKDVTTGINQFTSIQISTHYEQNGKNLTVRLSELPASSGEISIYNLQGKLITLEKINTLTKVIHLGDIAAGSYIVRVQTQHGSGAARIAVIE